MLSRISSVLVVVLVCVDAPSHALPCDSHCGARNPTLACWCDDAALVYGDACVGIRASCYAPVIDWAEVTSGDGLVTIAGQNLLGNDVSELPAVTIGTTSCPVRLASSSNARLVCQLEPGGVGTDLDVAVDVTWIDAAPERVEVTHASRAGGFSYPAPDWLAIGLHGADANAMYPRSRVTLQGLTHVGDQPEVWLDQPVGAEPVALIGEPVALPITRFEGDSLDVELPLLVGREHTLRVRAGGQWSRPLYFKAGPPRITSVDVTHIEALWHRLAIRGDNLIGYDGDPALAVTFNSGRRCVILESLATSESVVCDAPLAGPVTAVFVTSSNGTSDRFEPALDPLVVTGTSPWLWPTAGGAVTVTGANLEGVVAAALDGEAIPLIQIEPTRVEVVVPPGVGRGHELVLRSDNASVRVGSGDYLAPQPTTMAPLSGRANDEVVIVGQSFGDVGGEVSLGGVPARVLAWSDTRITVVVPIGQSRTAAATVTQAGQSKTGNFYFVYDPPKLSTLSFSDAGMTELRLVGLGFGSVVGRVDVGAGTCPIMTWSDTVITCLADIVGSVDVTVTASGQVSNSLAISRDGELTAITPDHGPAAGGTPIVVTGRNLDRVTSFTIAGVAAPIVVRTETSATILSPSGQGLGNPVIAWRGPTASNTLYFDRDRPVVTGVDLQPGVMATAGVRATVRGRGLSGGSVLIDGRAATAVSGSDTELDVIVPVGAGYAVPLVVVVGGVASLPFPFDYDAPTITTVTGTPPTRGGSITLEGHGFGAWPTVVLDDAHLLPAHGDTRLVVEVPAGVGTHTLRVLANGVLSAPAAFGYQAPGVDAVSVTRVHVGEQVTITGHDLGGLQAEVTLGGRRAAVIVQDHEALTFVVPTGAGTQQALLVAVGGQLASAVLVLDYAAPELLTVTPDRLSPIAPTLITLQGSGFGPAPRVTLGGGACTLTSTSPDALTCVAPVGFGDSVAIEIVADDQTSGLLLGRVGYRPPSLDRLTFEGPVAPGAQMTLVGSDFTPAAEVMLDDRALDIVSRSPTAIVALVPPGVGRDHRVRVVQGGQSSLASALDYAAPRLVSVTPRVAAPSSILTITGDHFGTTGALIVRVGAASCPLLTRGDEAVTCLMPEGQGLDQPLTLEVAGQPAAESLRVSYPAPVIDGLSPGSGPESGGTVVTVHGRFFGPSPVFELDGQRLDARQAAGAWSFTTPPGVGDGHLVRALAGGQASLPVPFDYELADDDGDGVADADDLCPGSDTGPLDPGSGCTLADLCPCAGPRDGDDLPWRNHQAFVACARAAAVDFVARSIVSQVEARTWFDAARAGTCGDDPCQDRSLAPGADGPRLVLQIDTYRSWGPGLPTRARVYAGMDELGASDEGVFVIPLVDAAGVVIRDIAGGADPRGKKSPPEGVIRLVRDGKGGVTLGLAGLIDKSSRVAFEGRLEVEDGRRGGERAPSLEHPGNGLAVFGDPGEDELTVHIHDLEMTMTVARDDDKVDFKVCR